PCKVVLADSHGIPRAPCYSGHVESRVNQQGPPCKAKYSWVTTNAPDQCNGMCLFIYLLTRNGS
ncbi:hypothetical protein S245_044541, partial [Arachis hypogaea]